MSGATERALGWVEQGLVPDRVVRAGIRRLLQQRLEEIEASDTEVAAARVDDFVAMMDVSPIAPLPEKANQQHYELPAEFFVELLGPQRKYSSCYWGEGVQTLEQAESESLRITCKRAGIADGMRILELGCGWGSLTLRMARHYPAAHITAVSNSAGQRRFIEAEAAREGLENLQVITADMNDFDTDERFDRVVSLEMFEHMRNYRRLFERVHEWLVPGGRFFMHIFCHRLVPYEFVERDASDWMSRHFFSGGIMPSDALPLCFQEHLKLCRQWRWNGRHYERTLNAWLERMDARKQSVMPILQQGYGAAAAQWWMRWRVFFMACAELFAYNDGQEWWVSHYLFERPAADGE
ncbi:MAG TPA: cyclopropane-fatty-acyl-phospholipid synthase family protein [Gammaproteobacteria bacterium]|nr:cyclopropane-fatty-acyl-phospholipid synthase family protein [Gammaproteobacteria bacterium]